MIAAGWALLIAASAAGASPLPADRPPFTTSGAFFAMSVEDLEASVRWYQEKLGLSVVLRPPPSGGSNMVALEGGGLLVELIEVAGATPADGRGPLTHGIFKVGLIVDDWDGLLAELERRGVPIEIGPFPASAEQRANLVIRDPEGNLIQFFGDYLAPPP